MKPLPNARRLLTLNALFSRREPIRVVGEWLQEPRLFDDSELPTLQALAGTQQGRLAAEVALEEGGRRQYAARGESDVVERRCR